MFVSIKLAIIVKLTQKYIRYNRKSTNKRCKSRESIQIYKVAKYSRIIVDIEIKNIKTQN